MNLASKHALFGSLFLVFSFYTMAQSAPAAPCALDTPVIVSNSVNIFSDQQEQDLGDALAEHFESEMRIAPPAGDDQLTRIGEKLLATLPPTNVHYSFRIYESGEINAFSIAGGHVYVSRKLIAAVKSEDELAGVLAHEIGHIRTHQVAIDVTNILRLRVGVTQVTDRADIFARVHQFMSAPAKSNEESESEERREIVADQMALYAMVRAGYAAESFPFFFNQITANKGKTGNWLTDKFGLTHENAQRYRAALKLISTLPEGCKGRKTEASEAFNAWQRGIMEERVKTVADGIDGDRPLPLDPPIQPSLWRIRFSPDGLHILAQDESGIAVIDKAAAKAMFRIDAPGVEAAQFSPDSKSIVFYDNKLRVEQWSVVDGKRSSVHELVIVDSCFQTLLTPDGHTLVCAFAGGSSSFPHMGLRFIDVDSGKPYFEKPNFFEPGVYSGFSHALSAFQYAKGISLNVSLMDMLASPDGKYLLLAAADHILAWDLDRREAVSLGVGLKKLYQNPMTFLTPHQLYEVCEFKGKGMYITRMFSFPDGQLINESEIGDQQIEAVSKGQNLIIRPLKNYPVGIYDPIERKVLEAAKLPTIDAWEKSVALENGSGGVSIGEMGTAELKTVPMPAAQLLSPRAAAFSPDGRYLALSMKNRAMIWNLETGKQVKMIRPFNHAWIDGENRLFGQFPKYSGREPVELRLSLSPEANMELGKYETDDYQYRNLQLRFKPMGKGIGTGRHATLEVKRMETQTVAWTHDYPHETPAFWQAEDNRLVLAWDLSNDSAKSEIKNSIALQKQENALNNHKKGLLIETVNPETGAPLEQVIVPEIDLTGGWDDSRRAMVSGAFVLAEGEHGNTVIYRIQDGSKIGEFFGRPLATNAELGIIAAVNRETEILLVDEHNGKELKRLSFASPVRLAHIVSNRSRALLVITADQMVHRIPLPAAEMPPNS